MSGDKTQEREATTVAARCYNCDWTGDVEPDMPHEIPGILERIGPGQIVPLGECPECGSLIYNAADNWLLIIHGDIEPEVKGPYTTEKERDQAARDHRRLYDQRHHDGLFPITSSFKPHIEWYAEGFFAQAQGDGSDSAG